MILCSLYPKLLVKMKEYAIVSKVVVFGSNNMDETFKSSLRYKYISVFSKAVSATE